MGRKTTANSKKQNPLLPPALHYLPSRPSSTPPNPPGQTLEKAIGISPTASGRKRTIMPRRRRDKGQALIDLDSDAEDGETFRPLVPPRNLPFPSAVLRLMFRATCCGARGALLDVLARWSCGLVGAALWIVCCLIYCSVPVQIG